MNTEASSLGLNAQSPFWRAEEEEERNRFRARAVWLVMFLLIIALAAGVWYAYPILVNYGVLPSQVAGVQNSLTAQGKRLDSTNDRVSSLVNGWGVVTERMGKLDSKLTSTLQAARKQTQVLATQVEQRVRAEFNQRIQTLQARVSQVETGQQSEQMRVAKLEQEVATLRQENARQLAQLQQDRQSDASRVDQQLTGLTQQVQGDSRDLAAVRNQVDRREVDFEAGVNHNKEVAPGIILQVNHTDVSYQRFSGWVSLVQEGRTVWVHGQGIKQPVVFYTKGDSRPRELVVTRVTKYSVVGYVRLPEGRG